MAIWNHGCSTVTVVSTSTNLDTTHLCNFRVYFMNQVEWIQVESTQPDKGLTVSNLGVGPP